MLPTVFRILKLEIQEKQIQTITKSIVQKVTSSRSSVSSATSYSTQCPYMQIDRNAVTIDTLFRKQPLYTAREMILVESHGIQGERRGVSVVGNRV